MGDFLNRLLGRRSGGELVALREQVIRLEQQRDAAIASAIIAADQETARLAALLNDLHEGVLVCNLQNQLVLFNQVALRLLRVAGEIGLGRSLASLMVLEPLQHCLDMLQRRDPEDHAHLPFLSRSHDGKALLQGRISLLRQNGVPSGSVITFDDVTAQLGALARRDALLREMMEILRRDLPPADVIKSALDHATDGYRRLVTGWWPMSDIHSGSLLDLVVRRLAGSKLQVSVVGLPIWLHGDGHSLALALDALLRALAIGSGVSQFDLSAEQTGDACSIVVSWLGPAVAADILAAWMTVPISPALGGLTVKDVMAHHSRDDPVEEEVGGRQRLKLDMLPPHAPPKPKKVAEIGSGRPEFFDFNLLEQGRGTDKALCSLREVTFVVFDCETTGLHPNDGDRMVSLAAVRIVGGRIMTGESFNRIINPGRPIPAESTRFHGLTDAHVQGKPPIEVVLPQFKAFAEDAILVAHNAAFDLKFLRMFEQGSGVRFDNPVLDTMLLSEFLDPAAKGHSLDQTCRRYDITIADRHTALGDSLAAAALLLRMIDGLERRGIHTLGEALTTLNMTLALHQRGQTI
jgi:DNA polymerase-3 subunit epsilon